MRRLLTSVLKALDVGIILTANDGDDGFEQVVRNDPDIVISDWHMEPMNGIELAQKIRTSAQSPNRAVPIILITGYSATPRVAEARDIGVTEFLVKPFSASDLAKRIAHVIQKPRNFIIAPEYSGPDRRRKAEGNQAGPNRRTEDKDR